MAKSTRGRHTLDPSFHPNGKTLATFDRPRASSTRLLVVSDPHLSPTAHGTLKCYHRSKQRLEMAFADAHRLDVDGVVLAGDLTKDGAGPEYALAGELLRVAPRPTVVVPGNHDVTGPADDGPVNSGEEFTAWLDRPAYPFREEIGDIAVTGVDSTCSTDAGAISGRVSADNRASIRTHERTNPEIAVIHHPLASVPDPFDGALSEDAYRVDEPAAVADAFVGGGVDLAITGHVHWPYAAEYKGVNVVGAPSSASFPPAYLVIDVTPSGTTVSLVPLAGEYGLSEAYEFALQDEYRGEPIATALDEGYFGQFPVVEQQRSPEPDPSRAVADLR